MSRLPTLLSTLLVGVTITIAKVVDHPECAKKLGTKTGRFFCPDGCRIVYRQGCPFNCNCQEEPVRCPAVSCPADPPICIVITRLDGCQSCACKRPVQVLSEEDIRDSEPGFLFFSLGANVTARPTADPAPPKPFRNCKPSDLKAVQSNDLRKCLSEVSEAARKHQRRRWDMHSLSPLVRPDLDELPSVCPKYRKALQCIKGGPKKRCESRHPGVRALKAAYEFPCAAGPAFREDMACIRQSHNTSYRLALCEDHTVRALEYVGRKGGLSEGKRKCEAAQWLVACEAPWIRAQCGHRALASYTEALKSAGNQISIGCFPQEAPAPIIAKCNGTQTKEVEASFAILYAEYRKASRTASLAFPISFSFSRRQIKRQCRLYQKGMKKLANETKNDCLLSNPKLYMLHKALDYPCSQMKQNKNFLKSAHCLFSLTSSSEKAARCEFLANSRLEDGSVSVCETYDILAHCLHDEVQKRCAKEAWAVMYEWLVRAARKYSPDCLLHRRYDHLSR